MKKTYIILLVLIITLKGFSQNQEPEKAFNFNEFPTEWVRLSKYSFFYGGEIYKSCDNGVYCIRLIKNASELVFYDAQEEELYKYVKIEDDGSGFLVFVRENGEKIEFAWEEEKKGVGRWREPGSKYWTNYVTKEKQGLFEFIEGDCRDCWQGECPDDETVFFDSNKPFEIILDKKDNKGWSSSEDSLICIDWNISEKQLAEAIKGSKRISGMAWHYSFDTYKCQYRGRITQENKVYNFVLNAGAWLWVIDEVRSIRYGIYDRKYDSLFLSPVWREEDYYPEEKR